jgi:protein-tyrosine phosphatase
MKRTLSICFVCTGNICRSPTAEAIMRRLVEERGLSDRIHIASAGTGGWHVGDRADRRSRDAGFARGYALDRRAQQFKRPFFERFDYVLAADTSNQAHLLHLAPDDGAARRVHLLRAFDPDSPPDAEVPDPYYGGPEGFEEVLDICEAACRGLLEHLVRDLEA